MPVLAWVAVAAAAALLSPPAAFAQATPPPDEDGIPPVVWELRSMTTGEDETVPPDPAAYTVQFLPDGELGVRADCNRGRGSYELDGSAIAVGPIGLTRMGCPPGSLDGQFVDLLARAATWSFADDALLLETAAGERLAFVPALTGVVWQWQEFQGGDGAVVAPPDPAAYTVAFAADGTLTLRADCNRGRGDWTADPPTIDIVPGAITLIGCGDDSLDGRFLADLDQAASFVFRGGLLYLALPLDAGIHAFAPALPEDEATPSAG